MGQTLCHHVNLANDSIELTVVNLNNIIKCPNNSVALNLQESKDLNYQSYVQNYAAMKYKKTVLDSIKSYRINNLQLTNRTNEYEQEESQEFVCEDVEFILDMNALDSRITLKSM
ncbi:Hypothetical_protein [Hexamita inflata]|uniref:Hypothetical_protein n=1 Tax=Hexamita inflata TaxID=28002 RepID=A0AA86UIT7_9EUKA|nr:Hypothetical protein HINF_LOCUS40831 [Hexamita inflata]